MLFCQLPCYGNRFQISLPVYWFKTGSPYPELVPNWFIWFWTGLIFEPKLVWFLHVNQTIFHWGAEPIFHFLKFCLVCMLIIIVIINYWAEEEETIDVYQWPETTRANRKIRNSQISIPSGASLLFLFYFNYYNNNNILFVTQ